MATYAYIRTSRDQEPRYFGSAPWTKKDKVGPLEVQGLVPCEHYSVGESGLISWDGNCPKARHTMQDNNHFEDWLNCRFNQNFGRYIAWILFSVASENLIKAAIACMSICLESSAHSIDKTLDKHLTNRRKSGKEIPSLLREMCLCASKVPVDIELVQTGYLNLKQIRNRDVYRYERGQRGYNFHAVNDEFVLAFNVLVSVMKNGGHFAAGPGNSTGS